MTVWIGEPSPTPLGPVWVAHSERGLIAVEIQQHFWVTKCVVLRTY